MSPALAATVPPEVSKHKSLWVSIAAGLQTPRHSLQKRDFSPVGALCRLPAPPGSAHGDAAAPAVLRRHHQVTLGEQETCHRATEAPLALIKLPAR